LLRMNECSTPSISWKIGCETSSTNTWICIRFYNQHFFLCIFFHMSNHCQVAYQSLILCWCICSDMHGLGGLQSANLMAN
jgi:hypothetical protein